MFGYKADIFFTNFGVSADTCISICLVTKLTYSSLILE